VRVRVPAWAWLLGGGALLLVARRSSSSSGYSYGGPDWRGISRDPRLLVPTFAAKLELVFQRMRALGFDPCLYEGYRTPARAAQLEEKGTGIAKSLHSYGGAVDITSCSKGWSDPAFFQALGKVVESLGLTWGGRFSRGDMPHVQAVPADEPTQNAFRATVDRDAFVRRYIA